MYGGCGDGQGRTHAHGLVEIQEEPVEAARGVTERENVSSHALLPSVKGRLLLTLHRLCFVPSIVKAASFLNRPDSMCQRHNLRAQNDKRCIRHALPRSRQLLHLRLQVEIVQISCNPDIAILHDASLPRYAFFCCARLQTTDLPP